MIHYQNLKTKKKYKAPLIEVVLLDHEIALVMASVAGYASAQSSATVYGIADTMYTKGNGSLTSKSGFSKAAK